MSRASDKSDLMSRASDKSLGRALINIQKDVNSKRPKDVLSKTEELLSKFYFSIKANVCGAMFLLTLGNKYKERAIDASIKAKDLIIAETDTNIDKDTLRALYSVCKDLNRWDIVTQCYGKLCTTSIKYDVLEKAFECHVREYKIEKQREIALRLYNRVARSGRYFFWVACALQLQAFCTDEPFGSLKAIWDFYNIHESRDNPEKLNSACVHLCISVLEQLQDYKAAIDLLSGLTSENRLEESYALRMEGRLLAADMKYTDAAEVFQKLLLRCPDDWEGFVQYLSCLLEDESLLSRVSNNDQIHPPKFGDYMRSHLSDAQFDSCIGTATHFVQNLASETETSTVIIRCPFLAIVEIERRKFLQGKADGKTLVKVLLDYFGRFGDLGCCILDVESSLHLLTKDDTIALVDGFKSLPQPDKAVPYLAQKINLFKLQELLELSLGELENNVLAMTNLFTQTLPLSNNLDLQDNMYGEDLLVLASNALVQLFWRTQHVGYLLEAILVLEFGLTVRRCIPQYKILLVHLYSHLGAFSLAYDLYKSLGFKNLCLETVSHHILPQMLGSPFLDLSLNLLHEYASFLERYFAESANVAMDAYHLYDYSVIFGNFLLRDRLLYSHNFLMSRIETAILQLKLKANKIVEAQHFLQSLDSSQLLQLSNEENLKALTINDDMETRPWWSPTPNRNYLLEPFEGISISHNLVDKNQMRLLEQSEKRLVLKRRSLLPQLVSFCIMSALSFLNQDTKALTPGGDNPSFVSLLEAYAGTLGFRLNEAEDMIHRLYSGETSFQTVSNSSVDVLCFAVFLTAKNLGTHGVGLPQNYWTELDGLFRIFTEEGIMPEHHLLIAAPGVLVSSFVQMVTEPLAWHSLVLQSCGHFLVTLKKVRKKKGPAEHLTQAKIEKRERLEQLQAAVISSIESFCATIELVIGRLTVLNKSVEEVNLDTVFPPLINSDRSDGDPVGPGMVFAALKHLSSSLDNPVDDYKGWVLVALRSWDAAVVARKLTDGLKADLTEFLSICGSKLVLLKRLRKDLLPLQFV